MHKRVISFLLSVVLVLGLFCVAAPSASAAGMKTSDQCIAMIKYFEGYSKYPYYDNGQYTVGYGTMCPADKLEEYRQNGISEQEAEAMLRDHLDSYEASLNSFASRNNLKWNQGQFDALLSFTYNCGAGWMSSSNSSTIRSAIVNGATGNDFIFAMGQWSTASGKVLPSLVDRRLIECNMYLNSEYSKKVPSNYRYVLFDNNMNGAENKIRVQAFDANLGDRIRATPTASGHTFSGWYTKASGGSRVKYLDETVATSTLYAHWDTGEDGGSEGEDQPSVNDKVIASGTVNTERLNVRSDAGTGNSLVGYLYEGDRVEIYETKKVNSTTWGRVEKGWISLDYVTLDPEDEEEKAIATGTVTASKLKIRSGAGTGYDIVDYVYEGDRVEIYETKKVGSATWGRVEKGWISLDYVKLDSQQSEEPEEKPDGVIAEGTVTASSLIVRKGPGSSYGKVGSVSEGTRVKIYETAKVGSTLWGRIDSGWVSLDYVQSDMEAPVLTASNVASSGKVKLTWTAVKGAAGYQVYRSTSKTEGFKLLSSGENTSLTDQDAEAGTRYYYYVVALNEDGIRSQASSTVARVCDLARPAISIGNVASSGKIRVTWQPVEGAVKYEVYRATSKDGTYTRKYTTTGTGYTNTGAEAGKVYYYKVKAIAADSAANSAFSSVKYRTCDLASPTISIGNVASSGKIKVTWKPVEGAVKYEIYRADSKNGTYTRKFTTTGTGYTNTGAEAGKTYYYKVRAIAADSAANSAFSSVKSRTCDLPQVKLSVTLTGAGKPRLSWNEVEGAVKYQVYRATDPNGTYSYLATVSGTRATNSSAESGVTYYYKVVAVASNTAANSAKSEAVSITTT